MTQTPEKMHATARSFVTVPEFAQIAGISSAHAWNLIWRREIPFVRFGRSVRIPRAQFERWVAEQVGVHGE